MPQGAPKPSQYLDEMSKVMDPEAARNRVEGPVSKVDAFGVVNADLGIADAVTLQLLSEQRHHLGR